MVVVSVLVLPISACGGGEGAGCDDYGAPALRVRVVDHDGQTVCDAAVTASDEGYREVLEPVSNEDNTGCVEYQEQWSGPANTRLKQGWVRGRQRSTASMSVLVVVM